MNTSFVIGAVVEDAHISAGLVDLATRKIIPDTLRRKKVNPCGAADEILASWTNIIKEIAVYTNASDVLLGLGMPGPCDYLSGMFSGNDTARYGSLYNKNIKELLGVALAISPDQIRMINDSVCFFQGEVFAGSVRNFKRSLGVTLGLGLGTALLSDGKVCDANLWSAPFKGTIAEKLLSSRYIVSRFKELSGIEVNGLAEMKTYSSAHVQTVFDEFAKNLSEFLIQVIREQQPEAIVVGGNMQASNKYFFDNVIEHLGENGISTPVYRTFLGEAASVMGAASIWHDNTGGQS